jgi:hypothetical protein
MNEIKRANAELLMKRFRESMAAAEAATKPTASTKFMTRDEFLDMQRRSKNYHLHIDPRRIPR